MRPEFVELDVPYDDTSGEDSEGAPSPLPEICVDHTVQVSGELTATDLRLEASHDGVMWVELDAFTAPEIAHYSGQAFRFIRVRTEAFVEHEPAEMAGSGGTFAGLEDLTVELLIDGVEVVATFTADDDTAAEAAARIDAAAVLAGLPVGTVTESGGELLVVSEQVGPLGTIVVAGGTGLVELGLTADAEEVGAGDTPVVRYGGMNVRVEA